MTSPIECLPTFQRTRNDQQQALRMNNRQARRIRKRFGNGGVERIFSFVPSQEMDRFESTLSEGNSSRNVTPRMPCRHDSHGSRYYNDEMTPSSIAETIILDMSSLVAT